MFVCYECCVLSGRGLCDGLITRPGETYRMWRVVVCDQVTSKTRRVKSATGRENTTTMGCNARKTNKQQTKDLIFLSLSSLGRFHSIDWRQDKKAGACKLALNTASFTNLHHATAHCTLHTFELLKCTDTSSSSSSSYSYSYMYSISFSVL